MGTIQRLSNWILQAVRIPGSRRERLLIVSQERYDTIERLCLRLDLQLNYTPDLTHAVAELENRQFNVVIYDQDMPGQDWGAAVGVLAQASPGSSVLLLSTLRQPDVWNEVIRKGGHDMLSKPIVEDGAASTIALARARAKLDHIRPRA